jgi:membrane protease YdiL (CAAX protease family)
MSTRTGTQSTATGAATSLRVAWSVLAVVELALVAVVVVRDVAIPAVVIVLLAAASLAVRRHGPGSLGFRRVPDAWRMARQVLVLMVCWTAVEFALVIPVANHLSGEKQDVSAFEDLQGNLGLLAVYLVLGWTLAAVVEEAAFRGYVQTRITDLLGAGRLGVVVAVLLSAVLFGLIHTEQGLVGVSLATLDGLLLGWLRWHYGTVWASVLAHGFTNSIGFVTFFLVGPVYGLW